MKKLLFSLALIGSMTQADSYYKQLTQAVINSDLELYEVLSDIYPLSPKEQEALLIIANDVVHSKELYMRYTIFNTPPSKELFRAAIPGAIAALAMITVTAAVDPQSPLEISSEARGLISLVGLTVFSIAGYKTIKQAIVAYLKPWELYDNALKIKQALLIQ